MCFFTQCAMFLGQMLHITNADVRGEKKTKNDAETLRRLLTQSDKLLISATMNGTFTKTEERRVPPEWCSRLQERSAEMDVTSSSVTLMKSVVFVCFFFSSLCTFVIYQRRVELFHIRQPLGWTTKRYVDKVSAILSFFSHLRWTGKTAEGHKLC